MISKEMAIKISLDARPAAELVAVASRYDSSVYIACDNKRVNAKSIMGMMSLALPVGAELSVTVDGADEEAAMAAIESYLSGK